ncbi:MAG: flavin reductase family protein [Acidimicrobiia bacterium]|nr:flavin reductase family protein [Acidimicrobiia bacterium]
MSDSIDGDRFRKVLGCVPTCVTVVTAMDGDEPVAMVIGSFGSVSLDPPLVEFMPGTSSSTWPRIERAGSFCVNVMGADQLDVCNAFFTKQEDPFSIHEWQVSDTSGAPRLAGSAAWIDCDIDQVVEAGDHYIVIGRVLELDGDPDRDPLVFHHGAYGSFREL